MKILARFHGKLKEFNYPPLKSYVHLKSLDTNEESDATAPSQKLLELDIIHPGDEFEIIIFEGVSGKPESQMAKKPIPQPQIQSDDFNI